MIEVGFRNSTPDSETGCRIRKLQAANETIWSDSETILSDSETILSDSETNPWFRAMQFRVGPVLL